MSLFLLTFCYPCSHANGGVSSGERWAKILALLPVMYLSAGICTALIIVGGGSMKMLFGIACGEACLARPLTTVEWYLVFVCAAVLLSQLPNLNSIAGVSLVGATAAVAYCTMIWVVSVAKGRVPGVSYDPVKAPNDVDAALGIVNGLGIIAFAFRGHNVVLEIQVSQGNFHFFTPLLLLLSTFNRGETRGAGH
jgi:amino acid permease